MAEVIIKLVGTYDVPGSNGKWRGYTFEVNGFTVNYEEPTWHQEAPPRTYLAGSGGLDVDLDAMFGATGTHSVSDRVLTLISEYESHLAMELLNARIAELTAAARTIALTRANSALVA